MQHSSAADRFARSNIAWRAAGLSPAEAAIMQVLVERRGVPMSREAIGTALLSQGRVAEPRMIDVYVARARTKLAHACARQTIETVPGRGYMIAEQEGAAPLGPRAHPSARILAMAHA